MASGSEQLFNRRENPMENVVVLGKLFELCDLSDLSRFRLVNRLWHDLSLKRWRAEKILRIGVHLGRVDDEDDEEGYPPQLGWKHVSILYEGEEWKKLETKPYRKYELWNVMLTRPEESNSSISTRTGPVHQAIYSRDFADMDLFWERCGPSMRRLDLCCPNISYVPALLKVILEKTPNLEHLRLQDVKWGGNCMRQNASHGLRKPLQVQRNLKSLSIGFMFDGKLPIKWELLFQHFPSLKKLELPGFMNSSEMLALVGALDKLNLNEHKMTIRSLNISDLFIPQLPYHVSLFECDHLKLESLKFGMRGCDDVSQTVLPRALLRNGHSLKKLVLINEFNMAMPYENLHFQVDPFSSLRLLRLTGNVFTDFRFLEKTPNLEKFHFSQYENELEKMINGTSACLLKNLVLPRVAEFVVDHLDNAIDYDCKEHNISKGMMEILVKMMPNVIHLQAPLTTGALQVVCQEWKELRSLDILCEKMSDDEEGNSGQKGSILKLTDIKYLEEKLHLLQTLKVIMTVTEEDGF